MPSTPAARLFRYGGITSLAGVCRFILKAFTNLIEQPIRKRCRKKSIKEAGTILQSVIQCPHLKLFQQSEFYSSLQSKQFLPPKSAPEFFCSLHKHFRTLSTTKRSLSRFNKNTKRIYNRFMLFPEKHVNTRRTISRSTEVCLSRGAGSF